jgi:hypothetical protein
MSTQRNAENDAPPMTGHINAENPSSGAKTPGAAASAWRILTQSTCPRRQCRGRQPHSRLVHWFGWVRR